MSRRAYQAGARRSRTYDFVMRPRLGVPACRITIRSSLVQDVERRLDAGLPERGQAEEVGAPHAHGRRGGPAP